MAIQLDADEFVGRLLNAAGLRHEENELRHCIDDMKKQMGGDARYYMNGDDFIELLQWEYRDAARERQLRNQDAVASALMASFEYDLLCKFPLFEALIGRVSGHSAA